MHCTAYSGSSRYDGKLETPLALFQGFPVIKGKIDGVVVERRGWGATAFRFQLHGVIAGKKASGIFGININALACNTYKLNWAATTSAVQEGSFPMRLLPVFLNLE